MRIDLKTLIASSAGLALGVLGTLAVIMTLPQKNAQPQYRSFADCIVRQARGLSKDIAPLAIVSCRELFPAEAAAMAARLKPPARVLTDEEAGVLLPPENRPPKDMPDDLISPKE